MGIIKNFPQPLIQKRICTPLIGLGCFIVGTATSVATKDRTLLILSGVLFFVCLIRMVQYYRLAKDKKYDVICGTCISITRKWMNRVNEVLILDDAGIESTLQLPKQNKIQIGKQYCFYFKKQESSMEELPQGYWKVALVSNYYIGFTANYSNIVPSCQHSKI